MYEIKDVSKELIGKMSKNEIDNYKENLKELYSAIATAQEAIFELGIGRVYTVIKVDDRRDLENRTLDAKVDTVNEMLK